VLLALYSNPQPGGVPILVAFYDMHGLQWDYSFPHLSSTEVKNAWTPPLQHTPSWRGTSLSTGTTLPLLYLYTHTHTHTHIYIYAHVCCAFGTRFVCGEGTTGHMSWVILSALLSKTYFFSSLRIIFQNRIHNVMNTHDLQMCPLLHGSDANHRGGSDTSTT
jgi:hypothetical protein